jgi:phosphate transport system substrate-binding protein
MVFLATPVAVSIGLVGAFLLESYLPYSNNAFVDIMCHLPFFALPFLVLASMWIIYAAKARLPEKASQLFLPILIAFCYYLSVWIIFFGVTHYNVNDALFNLFDKITIPYYVINICLDLTGKLGFFPIAYAAITLVTVLSILITCKIAKKNIIFDKKIIAIYCSAVLFLSGIVALQYYDRSTKILSEDYEIGRIDDEMDYYNYHPFYNDNKLKTFDEPATISFTENYPKLDGATALYPVYGAIAQELYKGLDSETVEQYVTCSSTPRGYHRLINGEDVISGEIDIFFGLQPSRQQIEEATEKGVEFSLTPIAKEAFVFFVNKDNPVNSLTLEQIQDIYQKKITNWETVGGKAEKIMPFQRPENSGSQTIMLARVMGDKPLPPPLREEKAAGMGGIINHVATYRNYSSSIGYSFRFFSTGMKPNANIKLLAINGIEPSVENIRNGSYPFTVDVYAVTVGSTNENTQKLIQWILSEQGQGFIETCGYVRR